MTSESEPAAVAESPAPDASSGAIPVLLGIAVVVVLSFLDAVVPPAGIPLAVLGVWLILRREGAGWGAIGFRRPASWPRTILTALGMALAWQLVAIGGLLLARSWAGVEGPDISRFEAIGGNPLQLAQWLAIAWTTAAFGEEIIWRGFLMTRIAGLLGGSRRAWVVSLLLSSTIFGLLHLYQGPAGVLTTGIAGLLLGTLFLVSGRNLWLPIFTHGFLNTLSFLALYFGLARYLESF